jgi:hypothetical protein
VSNTQSVPDDDPVRCHQLVGGVEADVADHAGHERVVPEPCVEARVGYDDRAPLVQHGAAHRVLPPADRRVEADGGDLVLLGVGDQVDRRHRHPRHLGGHLDQRQEVAPRGGVVQDPVALDLRHPLLVGALHSRHDAGS